MWGSGVGRSPNPDCPPTGRAAVAHYPLAVGAGGCRRGDPSPTSQRALLRAGFAGRGGGMRVPGGGASCLGVGRPESGALPPPTARPLGGLPGPTTHWLWVRGGAGVGTCHQPHSARSCELALRAVGAARRRPGGAPPAWVWGVRGQALSRPRPPALLEGCWAPLPTGYGCGGVPAWRPVTNPTARALACCGGGMMLPGGAPLAWVWGVRGRAHSHPRLPALWAGCRGPLPTGCGCGGVRAWGPVTNPIARALASWLCALWGRQEGARGGRLLPGCGASGVGRSPTNDCLPITHWLWVRGGAGVGTRHQPHSARSCVLWGRHEGARGGRLLPGCGASGVGHSPTPNCPPSGRAAGAHYPLAVGGGVRAWGPVTHPTARAPSSWLCALEGRLEGAPWGHLLPGCGASGSGALPPPTARPLGRLLGPITHWLWVRGGAGVGTRHQPHSARSCVLWERHEGALGGRLLPGCGVSGVGHSPTPDCPPSGRAAGAHYPLAVGGGVRAWGPVTHPTARAPSSWLRALGGRLEGAQRGHLLPGCGPSGVGRSPTPDHPSFWACGRGPLPTGRGCGVRARGPGGPWHLVPCRGSWCVVRSTWWPLWLGTCPRAVVVAGGVPLWRASWPRVCAPLPVWSGRSRCSGRLSGRRGDFPNAGGCRPRLYWVAAQGTWRPAENRAHCACCWPLPRQGRWARSASYPLGALRWGCPWRVPPASVLSCVRCGGLACVDLVTDASLFLYRLSCDGGLGWSTGAVSCGRRHRPTRVGGRHARVPRVCACACPAWPVRVGRPLGRVLVRLTFPLAVLGSLFACSAPSGLGLPRLWLLLGFFFFVSFPLLPLVAPPLCPALRVFRPWVPWALAACPPPLCFSSPPPPCCRWRFLLSGCLGPLRPPFPLFFFFFSLGFLVLPFPFFLFFFWCVFWRVVLCVPCPARSLCCARLLCCFWWLVLLVPGVAAFCTGSAGGSGCLAFSFGGLCRLWCPCLVWLSLGVFPVVSCSTVLCPVALCCCVGLCCGALSSFFVFLPVGGAGFLLFPVGSGLWAGSGSFLFLCSACAVLCWCACVVALCSVFSCPRGAGWCFVLLPVVFVCLLLGLAVVCCLLVGPGGSRCRVPVACCCVSLGAVLRRVAARCAAWRCVVVRCVVSFCSVCCCRALCCVLGRCPSS